MSARVLVHTAQISIWMQSACFMNSLIICKREHKYLRRFTSRAHVSDYIELPTLTRPLTLSSVNVPGWLLLVLLASPHFIINSTSAAL